MNDRHESNKLKIGMLIIADFFFFLDIYYETRILIALSKYNLFLHTK